MQLVTFLRARLTDYNSSNRGGENWIYPRAPRKDLGKNSYPRISVQKVGLVGEVIDVGGNMEKTVRLQIDIWNWADPKDPLLLTISTDSNTVRSGADVCDVIADDVETAIETYKSDFNDDTKKFHDPKFVGGRDMPDEFDATGVKISHHILEVEFTYI